jgi:hypothetical protein
MIRGTSPGLEEVTIRRGELRPAFTLLELSFTSNEWGAAAVRRQFAGFEARHSRQR